MENSTQAIEMPYSKMKEYLSEWYYEAEFSTVERPAAYDSMKVFHILKENNTGEEVFVWMSDLGEPFVEDTVVSTMGIVGDELRGLIEQCYVLDMQMKADAQNTAVQNNQKGE